MSAGGGGIRIDSAGGEVEEDDLGFTFFSFARLAGRGRQRVFLEGGNALDYLFWNQTWERKMSVRGEGKQRGGTHLDLARGHLQVLCELLAGQRARFLVADEDRLEAVELGGGRALAGLDDVGDVVVEHLAVDLRGVHMGGNEGGDVGPVVVGRRRSSVEMSLARTAHNTVERDRCGRDDRRGLLLRAAGRDAVHWSEEGYIKRRGWLAAVDVASQHRQVRPARPPQPLAPKARIPTPRPLPELPRPSPGLPRDLASGSIDCIAEVLYITPAIIPLPIQHISSVSDTSPLLSSFLVCDDSS